MTVLPLSLEELASAAATKRSAIFFVGRPKSSAISEVAADGDIAVQGEAGIDDDDDEDEDDAPAAEEEAGPSVNPATASER
jgi:hypothetical protein